MRVQVVRDRTVNERWPVLDYEFGNGCDRSIRVHLQRAHVTARWNGHRRPLEPFDPRDEIGSAVLDARARGSARIAYVAPDDARGRPTDVCVDLQEVELEGLPRPVCFVRKEGRMIAVDDVGPGKEGRAR